MVEKTKELTKRARWVKIKRELLKLPKKWPEITGIAIDTKNEAIKIVTDPVSIEYEINLWDIGRHLRYKYGISFENYAVDNLASFIDTSWKKYIVSGYKIIYERQKDGK